jgi:hypothetical protein
MPKITTKIELTEDELRKSLSEHYNLKTVNSTIRINTTEADRGQGTHTTITIEGEKTT